MPTSDAIAWTGVSIIVLLAGIGGLRFWHAVRRRDDPPDALPERDPMLGSSPTRSQLATVKYFWVVCALVVLQIAIACMTVLRAYARTDVRSSATTEATHPAA